MSSPSNSAATCSAGTIFTIGHSTRAFSDFLSVLKSHGIQAVADVRTIPRSARYPHFSSEFLGVELPKAGIDYLPFKSLGGLRHSRKDSPNTGWRNESFRGYADFMQTPAFAAAVEELMNRAREKHVVTMCAEAVPWRCHRSLISDALLVRGWQVFDIFDEKKSSPHELTPFARVDGLAILYPPQSSAAEPGLFGD